MFSVSFMVSVCNANWMNLPFDWGNANWMNLPFAWGLDKLGSSASVLLFFRVSTKGKKKNLVIWVLKQLLVSFISDF